MSQWWASTTASFGYWVRRQRKALDLTQLALADRVGCALTMIKKIEADERRPSRQVAERLAECLGVSASQRQIFFECARGLRPVDHLLLAREPLAAPTPARRVSLPSEAMPFIGRSAELTQIATCLSHHDCRLLTLVGMGGVGKTRLAIRA